MRKHVLFFGIVCGFNIPLHVLAYTYDYDSFAIKKNPLPQSGVFEPIYIAGYHCNEAIFDEANIVTANVAGYGQAAMYYTGVGYSTVSQDEAFKSAEADCHNNIKIGTNGRGSWTEHNFSYDYSTFIAQVNVYNKTGYKLETYPSKTDVGMWYCAVPGYQNGYSNIPTLRYGGAVGYGSTQAAALTEMTNTFTVKNSPKSNMITPAPEDPLIYRSHNLLDSPYCAQVADISQLVRVNSHLVEPAITLSTNNTSPDYVQGYITNLENTGSDVKYTCFVSDSINGIYTEVPRIIKAPDGELPTERGCVVVLNNEGLNNSGFVVRAPILGDTDKWIKIQAQRIPTIDGDGANATPVVYSNPVKITAVKKDTPYIPRQPQLTVSYADNKTIAATISNIETPVSDYSYRCIYTTKANADKPTPANDQVVAFPENSSICSLKYNDNNTISLTVNLSTMPEQLKGLYFAVRAYKKSVNDPYYSSFSRVLPLANIPCNAPTGFDFGNIDKTLLENYSLNIPFKSTRTLATTPYVLGWNKQTQDFTKPIAASSNIVDYIDKNDQTNFYDYRIYNICEGNIKSEKYCTVRVFNPGKNPGKDPLICTANDQIKN